MLKLKLSLLLAACFAVLPIGCSENSTKPSVSAKTEEPAAPKADAPKADAPKADAPKADAPKADAPKAGQSGVVIHSNPSHAMLKKPHLARVSFEQSSDSPLRIVGKKGEVTDAADGAPKPKLQASAVHATSQHSRKVRPQTSAKLPSNVELSTPNNRLIVQ